MWSRIVLASALLAALAAPAFAQQAEIEKLAGELARKLNHPRWALTGEVKIVVVSFQGPEGKFSKLGQVLASTFATALQREAGQFKILDRSEFSRNRQKELWPESDALNWKVAQSVALEAGAVVFIDGTYGEGTERIRLEVDATRISDDKVLGEVHAKIPLSVELQRLAVPPPPDRVFHSGWGGVGLPECVSCPQPTFKRETISVKFVGRVWLKFVVTPEGNVVNLRVVEGPKNVLTESALEAVRKWKFKPATNKAGQPVPVDFMIEFTFRETKK